MAWVLITWSVLAAGLIVWLAEAQSVLAGPWGRRSDDTSCATCRHDWITHEHAGPGRDCSQCPCPAFRR